MVEPLNNTIRSQLTRVTRESLNEKVAAQIKALILSKGIRRGWKLPPERELTSLFGVSRAVVREALKSLEQSGLLEIRTGASGGAFIVNNQYIPLFQVSYDLFSSGELTLSHFYEARMSIECGIVRLAALKATDQDLERLDEINRRLMSEQTEPSEQGENNNSFHIALAKIAGNPLMLLIVESLMRLLTTVFTGWDQIRTRDAMLDMYKRHKAIIDAIRSRDASLCEERMAVDVDYTRNLAVSSANAKPHAFGWINPDSVG
ncbi:MAG: FadR family transcriptional regulator [Deltaproteobacteria bacterium]|nr:FadR family transcriptional regulator [Deltaproteobacteria bacterium]